MKHLLVLAIIGFLTPFGIFAHGSPYFEFNPDYFKTNSLNVSSQSSIYQTFLPVNDFFRGFDLWFDNAGNSGQVFFELYDHNNNPVKNVTITIPHIDPIAGGQRIHIDWNSQLAVVGNNKYKLKIESSLPQLRIYYADRIGLLVHNAPYISKYLNGIAEVGGEEVEFSFKFALYETTETSLPVLSNVIATVLSYNQVKLEFNANEPADYKVEYDLVGQGYTQTIPFSGTYSVCTQRVALCSMLLNVFPNSIYQYILTVKDVWGNQVQQQGIFNSQTLATFTPILTPSSQSPTPTATVINTATPINTPVLDNISPLISNLEIAYIDDKSAHIYWETNEAANSSMVISFTTEKITIAAASDPIFELLHLLKIENQLSPGTPYLATVTSYDSASNIASTSISFTTLAVGQASPSPTSNSNSNFQQNQQPDNQSPVTVSVNNTESLGNNESFVEISWIPGVIEPSSGYRVDILDESRNLLKTVNLESGTHSVIVSGLPKGDKSVIVYSNNDGIYEKIALPVRIQDPPFIQRLLALWPLLVIILILIIGLAIWKIYSRKLKTSTA